MLYKAKFNHYAKKYFDLLGEKLDADEGYSIDEQIRVLKEYCNDNGFLTKKGKTFSLNAIKKIVTNPVYAGYIRYNMRRNWNEKRRNNINPAPVIQKAEHPAIITEEMWTIAKGIFKRRSGMPNRVHDDEIPLTGILRCPVCGSGTMWRPLRP